MKILVVTILLILFRPGIADKPDLLFYCVRKWPNNIQMERACVRDELAAKDKIIKIHPPRAVLNLCGELYLDSFGQRESCIEQEMARRAK